MNKLYGLILVLLGTAFFAHAEVRTWTSAGGKSVEGEYISLVFEKVTIKLANGDEIKLPLDQLCEEDRTFVEMINPPKISIDYRESTQPKEFIADPWEPNGGGNQILNHPIYYMDASFGALIKQKSSKVYNHDLTIEMFIFTEQYLDPDKYHLIGRVKSEPFQLTKENDFRYVYTTPRTFRIMYYNLYSTWKRGEKPSTYLIIVRDELGNIVDYKARNEWLYKYLNKLEELPVNAWLNDRCDRVHPTQPPRTRRDGR